MNKCADTIADSSGLESKLLVTLFKTLILPPAMQILMLIFAWACWYRCKWLAKLSLIFAVSSLLLLSMPIVSESLFVWLERPYVRQASLTQQSRASAVVVLGAGRMRLAPEFNGRDQLSHQALWRVRYGAHLARKWEEISGKQLAVIVSGGVVKPYELISEAQMAAELLRQEFAIDYVIEEPASRDTWQNARNTAEVLARNSYSTVLLVTHAYHMRRAQYAFEQAGVDVIPMATGFFSSRLQSKSGSWYGWWDRWLPQARYLSQSYTALHEYLGLAYYWLR